MRSAPARIALAVTAVAALAVLVDTAHSKMADRDWGQPPVRLTAGSSTTGHFEYVISAGALHVYSVDRSNQLVESVDLPQIGASIHGVVASPRTGKLYVAYGAQRPPGGSLLAYNLRRDRVLWQRRYRFGIDSMAISPNGRWIYMPAGEATTSGAWRIIAASSGRPTGRAIRGPSGAHNTIVGPDGDYLYLGGVLDRYLEVASTATNTVIRKVGPLNPPGVRPFTINGSQTLAFTTANDFLGFQVSNIVTGDVLYTVPVPGFAFDPGKFAGPPDHGISLSPDERELYLIDTPHRYVHVFDVSGLPASAPQLVADVHLHHAPGRGAWLQHSRNGRYVYVGRDGDVIDTRRRRVVDYLPPLRATADFLEIDWRGGRPVATTNRYGIGYVRRPPG